MLPNANYSSSINYNASARKWQVIRGSLTAQFERGPKGKQAAQTLLLDTDAPIVLLQLERLTAKYQTNESLVKRAWKAAMLAGQGFVLKPYASNSSNELARVANETEIAEYAITNNYQADFHSYHCTCIDWSNGNNGTKNGAPTLPNIGPLCKHILAYIFVKNADIPLADHSPSNSDHARSLWDLLLKELDKSQINPAHLMMLEQADPYKYGRGQLIMRIAPHNIKYWLSPSLQKILEARLKDIAHNPISLIVQGV
jgi:hypothetical protein